MLRDYETSESSYKKILDYDGNDFLALNNLATLYERTEKPEASVDLYTKLTTLYPDNYEAIRDTIRVLTDLKRNDEALKALENFSQNFPEEKKTDDFNNFVSQMYESLHKS